VAAIGLSVLLAGCTGGGNDDRGGGSGNSFVAGDGAVTIVATKDRGEPVNLSGKTIEGERLDVVTFRGQPVVVNVWGSWCAPCRKEAPDLQAAYTQLKPSGVAFLGIDTRDDDPAQAKAFQDNFGITYPSIVDSAGTVLLNLRGVVAPRAVPTTLVLDEQGRVAARVSGPVTTATLVGLVKDTRLAPAP
jgi:thiol-disulfide isomerase/thioredoxin